MRLWSYRRENVQIMVSKIWSAHVASSSSKMPSNWAYFKGFSPVCRCSAFTSRFCAKTKVCFGLNRPIGLNALKKVEFSQSKAIAPLRCNKLLSKACWVFSVALKRTSGNTWPWWCACTKTNKDKTCHEAQKRLDFFFYRWMYSECYQNRMH